MLYFFNKVKNNLIYHFVKVQLAEELHRQQLENCRSERSERAAVNRAEAAYWIVKSLTALEEMKAKGFEVPEEDHVFAIYDRLKARGLEEKEDSEDTEVFFTFF